MGNSLLEAAAATFDFPLNGSVYKLAYLTYRDQAEVVAESIRRDKEAIAADAKAAGVTGEALYAKLRAVDAEYANPDRDPFVVSIFRVGGTALDDAFRRVIRRTVPQATPEQVETAVAAFPPDEQWPVVKRAAGLRDKEPEPGKEGGKAAGESDPRSGGATGPGASPASAPPTAA